MTDKGNTRWGVKRVHMTQQNHKSEQLKCELPTYFGIMKREKL